MSPRSKIRPRLKVVRPIGPVQGVRFITEHAARRFRERTGFVGSEVELTTRLECWLQESQLVQLLPGRSVIKLLNNKCRPATYRMFGEVKRGLGFVLVIEAEVLVTIHRNDSGEWILPETNSNH